VPKAGDKASLVGCGLGRQRVRAWEYFTVQSLLRFAAILVFFLPLVSAGAQTNQAPSLPVPLSSEAGTHDESDRTCAQCHAAIYKSYQQTAMAHASGPSKGNVIPGEFTHSLSRVHYKVYEQDDKVWLSFDRNAPDAMQGKRELLYFIGSGHRGRTYVFSEDGFFFESPVNWYGQKSVWDMTPAYQDARHIPLTLPLSSECLSCHTNDLQQPVPGTENKYSAPIIMQEGIGCARCHGPGGTHSRDALSGDAHSNRNGAIVNPAKLSASRRDGVCMQCHLEGSVAIRQPGRNLSDFTPGEDLQDYVHYYVLAQSGPGLPALSQFEALFQSKCKQKSGDAMSCMSCHDPHSSPAPAEKVAYYRSKCLACHGETFAAKHHPKQQDCMACHMPTVATSNIAHTQATDHRILRNPHLTTAPPLVAVLPQLKRFPPTDLVDRSAATNEKQSDRDLAMAWQSLAEEGMEYAVPEAEKYLRTALAVQPDDATLLTAMGFVAQKRGEIQQAKSMYEKALEKDPLATVAATNLGVIAAQAGELDRAIALWKAAFDLQPERSAIGINLAKALCAIGKPEEARDRIKRVLEFNPDLPDASKMLQALEMSPSKCGPQ
jgi:predicted CXXCH cytochrome family protein